MILITGAGGYIGRRLVRRLRAQGHTLRCLATPQHARYVLDDPAIERFALAEPDDRQWSELVAGIHTIIHLRSAMWWGGAADQSAVEIEGTKKLISAARNAQVGRIVLISHLNAATASGIETLRIKSMQEDLLRNSGIAHTIIRSSLVFGEGDSFISHLAANLYLNPLFLLTPSRGEFLQQPLYVNDLVEAILRSLNSIDLLDTTVSVGGPELLSFQELLQTIARVLSIKRTMLPIPPFLLRGMNRVWRRFVPRSLITDQWFDLVFTSRTTDPIHFARTFALQPQRLEDTLQQYLPRQNHFGFWLRRVFRRAPRRNRS
ncbi:MAG: NAD-dependent epimerase/dehydratase family protein [Anaerolineaceae bacterium]|nr:NAD-dependent epimerase/dehydratase family protein [Anaerolineaceae bacterium]